MDIFTARATVIVDKLDDHLMRLVGFVNLGQEPGRLVWIVSIMHR